MASWRRGYREIRSSGVTALVSTVAEHGQVRRRLVGIQKAYGKGRSLVTEGRDQGTAVFPFAFCKFFLIADVNERALRRFRELEMQGVAVNLDELAHQITERDRRDATREIGPMVAAQDAILIDSTGHSIVQVVDTLENHVNLRRAHVHD